MNFEPPKSLQDAITKKSKKKKKILKKMKPQLNNEPPEI